MNADVNVNVNRLSQACQSTQVRLKFLIIELSITFAKFMLFGVISLASFSASAAVYKWVDQNGRVNYAETPPPGVNAQRVNTVTGESTTTRNQRQQAQEQLEAATASLDEERDERANRNAGTTEDEARQAELNKICNQLRQNLATINNSPRIRSTNEAGELVYLSGEQINARRSQIQLQLDENCQ